MKKDPLWLALGIYGAVGFQLAIAVVGGWFLGDWCDQKWGSAPWLALAGLILGFLGGFYNLLRLLRWRQNRQ